MEKIRTLLRKLLTKEVILYLVFGGLTTVIDFIVFYFSYNILHIDEMVSTAIAWCFAVIFAYVTNRLFVFESKEKEKTGLLREFGLFIGARLLSLGISELIVLLIMKVIGFDSELGSIVTKLVCAVVVVIFNYFASKFVIFRKGDSEKN